MHPDAKLCVKWDCDFTLDMASSSNIPISHIVLQEGLMSINNSLTRRDFIKYSCAISGLAAFNGRAFADQQCTNFDFRGVRMCEAGIRSYVASQTINSYQYKSQWCWAACISMIFKYYDHPVSQSKIVRRVFGTSMANMPAMPEQILEALNVEWEDDHGDTFTPEGDYIMTHDINKNTILASQLLADDTPIIIGSLGHATVLTAMSWAEDVYGRYIVNSLTVRDPMQGKRIYSPREAAFANFMAVVKV